MRRRVLLLALGLFVMGANPVRAQEEDSDYRELTRKVTTNANCLQYLNDEHDAYSGDKMAESLAPDEVTKGLSKAIRDECQKSPKESVDTAVSKVNRAYRGKLSDIMNRMKDDTELQHGKGGA